MTGNFWPMTRGDTFERVMSTLTAAIGDAARLDDLAPDQTARLHAASARLASVCYEKEESQ